VTARQVFLKCHAVAFAKPPAMRGDRADAVNPANVFVSHNPRWMICLIGVPIATANAGCLDLKDAAVRGNLRKRVFADFGGKGTSGGGC
jgi:hypothetical protein